MNKTKNKVKIKKKSTLTPVTISVVSLGVFMMMITIAITPQLMNMMGNSVTKDNKYIIVYESNGGRGTMPRQIVSEGKTVKLMENHFEFDGYSFNGWRAKRSDNKWLCYVDKEKVYNEWTDQSYCNTYGYSLFNDQVYIKDIVSTGYTLYLYADWIKSN